MRVPLEPGDRKILIVSALLLVLMTVAALLFSPPASTPSIGYPSSYSAANDGAKAAYLLLGELGYKVERCEKSPEDLLDPPETILLVLADPFIPASAAEKWRIQRFIAKGGRVLGTGWMAASLLPESDLAGTSKPGFEGRKFRALLPGAITRQAPQIELRPAVHWSTKLPHHLTFYGDAEGATVVSYRVGEGQVIWWADSTPLTNYGLTQASNLMLFLNSLGPPEQRRVLWDEYFHGQRPGFVSYLKRTPAPWALLQFVVLAAALIITYSRRSGPVRALATSGSRLSPLEFIETLGDLYQRKRATTGALEIAYHRFRFLLLRRLGLPSAATPEEIWGGVRDRLGEHESDFFKTLQRCERGAKAAELSEAEALGLIRELHDYTQRWRLAGRFRGE